MSRAASEDRARAWQALVGLVMDSRGDWRRKVVDATGQLPFSRVRALRRLQGPPLTLRELAASMTTDAPATTVIVNDLEERGLVRREPHPDDRRTKLVSLTPAGKRTLRAVARVKEEAPACFDALGDDDVDELLRIVTLLRGA